MHGRGGGQGRQGRREPQVREPPALRQGGLHGALPHAGHGRDGQVVWPALLPGGVVPGRARPGQQAALQGAHLHGALVREWEAGHGGWAVLLGPPVQDGEVFRAEGPEGPRD